MVEGRLRMNTVSRQDGVKEKRAEVTLSRLHPLGGGAARPASPAPASSAPAPVRAAAPAPVAAAAAAQQQPPTWNASPLVPDLPEGEDEIPF